MNNPLALALLSPLALASSASAQVSFDLILPNTFDVRDYEGGYASNQIGMIVNTGNVPISILDFDDASFHGISTDPLELFAFMSSWANSQSFVLQPGEASGVDDPAYHALLGPTETYVPGMFGGAILETDAVDGLSPEMTVHFEVLGQRVRATLNPTFDAEITEALVVHTATRWSSLTVPPSIEVTSAGCDFPGYGPVEMHVGASASPPGGTLSRSSDLPFIGNDRFRIFNANDLPVELIGSPYMILMQPAGGSLDLLSCDVIGGTNSLSTGALFQHPLFGDAVLPGASVPIPNIPDLVGKRVAFQSTVITPLASNGLFFASNAIEVLIGSPDLP